MSGELTMAEKVSALAVHLYSADCKSYDDQRAACVKLLEQHGFQCYDNETVKDLLTAIASNIDDGDFTVEDLVAAAQ